MRKIFPVCCASTATAASNAPASRIDASAVFLNSFISGVIYHTDGSGEKCYLRAPLLSWLSGKCPSVVSDENTGRPTCGHGGMRRGVYTKSRFFRIQKQKGNSLSLGLSRLAHASGTSFDHLISPVQHCLRNRQADLFSCL